MIGFSLMARNNAFANDRLLSACLGLQPGEWAAPRGGIYPSLRDTLLHIYTVDLFFMDALTGGGMGRKIMTGTPLPTDVADLLTEQWDLDARLIHYCEDLRNSNESIWFDTSNGPVQERIGMVLQQLFQHQIHHRGQAHSMMASSSVKPPRMDRFYLACDHNPANPLYS